MVRARALQRAIAMPPLSVLVAIAIVAGTAGGLASGDLSATVPRVVLGVAWLATVVTLAIGAGRTLVATMLLGFGSAAWVGGAIEAARVKAPSIRTLVERQVLPLGVDAEPALVEGRLARDAMATDYGASLLLSVERVRMGGPTADPIWAVAHGGLRLTVSGEATGQYLDRWRAGRRIRLPVVMRRAARYLNWSTSDQEDALLWRGVALLGSTKSALLVDVVDRGRVVDEASAVVRALVRRRVRASVGRWSERSGAIVTALLIGDRAGLDPEVLERLQAAGTYHVLAISGGNVAIMTALALLVLQAFGVPPRSAALSAAAVVAAYGLIVGPEASVVRATLVAVVYLLARGWDLRAGAMPALGLAAAIVCTASPATLRDVGFALSFGAAVAIVAGVSRCASMLRAVVAWTPLARIEPRRVEPAIAVLAATVCAEVALAPVAAYAFSRVSVAGLGLNLIAIPVMTVAQVAGMASVVAAAIPALGAAVGLVAHVSAEILVRSAAVVEVVPWLSWRVPPPGWIVLIGYYGSLGWALGTVARGRRTARVVFLAALAVVAFGPVRLPRGPASRADAGWLTVTTLDVGQGDATFVRFPQGRTLLVDAGGTLDDRFDVGSRVVVPAVWALGVRRLDWLAITHGDPDHVGGAAAVVRELRPREVWEGVHVPASTSMARLRDLSDAVGARWAERHTGDRWRVDGVDVRVWHPPEPDWERPKVRNDDSIVLELTMGVVSVLLTGDIGAEVERSLTDRLLPTGIRVVKIPHHGSRTSSTPAFIAASAPRVGVASAGASNRFGHPAPDVMRRYREAGVLLFRTDRDGAVTMRTDGLVLEVRTVSGRYLRLSGA